jgi:DNA (cytosine-5)-methyltransferase 1
MEIVSLFSGCGGTDLGFEKAGHDIVFANDIDKYACDTYKKNLGYDIECLDIAKVPKFQKADVLVGCYPCQGFSIYGSRVRNDPRNFLYLEFVRALRQTKPKFFLSENVKGLLYGYGNGILKGMLKEFRAAGYKPKWQLINVKNYGVPQDRQRVFIVGVRDDLISSYEFPEETHGEGLKPFVTLRDTIYDMPRPPKEDVYYGTFSSHYMSRNRKKGWDESSFTIQASGRHAPLHPSGKKMQYVKRDVYKFCGRLNRRLSYKECAAIQSFPNSFKFEGHLESKYRQIGNAVPPLMAKIFAESFG